jgi:hypothetical protein
MKDMKISRFIIAAGFALALSSTGLTSCSSSDIEGGEGSTTADGSTVTFSLKKGFAEDSLTRAAAQPETQRVILADGLLVDATLTDVGTAATRSTTTYEPVPDNSKGVAFVCDGTTIIAQQNFTVSNNAISIYVPNKGLSSYNIYFYLNEDGNLTLSDLTGASVGSQVTGVAISNSRDASSKDDYAKASVSSSAKGTIIKNDGEYLTFTPLNAELMLEVQAGVTPLSGFVTTLSGIQTGQMTNIHITDGTNSTYTPSATALTTNLKNECYTTEADRQYPTDKTKRAIAWKSTDALYASYAGALYGDTLWSSGGYQRFVPISTSDAKKALLTITSISGPDGSVANYAKQYTSNNTMTFKSTTYQNGHRYKLILQLATPINGYEGVGTDGVATAVPMQVDNTGTECLIGKLSTNGASTNVNTTYKPKFSASASWPAVCGRPQYYKWDASAYCPTTGSDNNSDDYASNGATTAASHSCKNCPTYNQITWFLKGGFYIDTNARWYCPNGFKNNNASTTDKLDVTVHTGGGWLKFLSKISGYDGTATAKDASNNVIKVATANIKGEPGVDKLNSTVTNPNEWFFLPSAGAFYYGKLSFDGGDYWSSTPEGSGTGYALSFDSGGCWMTAKYKYLGWCLWDATSVLGGGNAGSTTSSGVTDGSTSTNLGNH